MAGGRVGLEAEGPPSCPRSVVPTPGASSSEDLLPSFLVAFVLVILAISVAAIEIQTFFHKPDVLTSWSHSRLQPQLASGIQWWSLLIRSDNFSYGLW